MTTTDNAPVPLRVGGVKSYADFFDGQRLMVKVPDLLYQALKDPGDLFALRDSLKSWFVIYLQEVGGSKQDYWFYDYLDQFLTELIKPVLYRDFLQSHNIEPDSNNEQHKSERPRDLLPCP